MAIGSEAIWRLCDVLGVGVKPQRSTTMRATVTEVQLDGTVWVTLSGSTQLTPISQSLVQVTAGDEVNVTISGGRATISGSTSNQAVGNRQVVEKVKPAFDAASRALISADKANTAATNAESDAARAFAAANDAEVSAANAYEAAVAAQGSATAAASQATIATNKANEAIESANVANAHANAALNSLSVVEDVSGTLTWISEHGSYVATTDTTVQEGTVYFALIDGEYTPVIEPTGNPSAQGWYVLDISDSQSEYVMAHLAVTSQGLWILPSGKADGTTPDTGESQADSDARQASGSKMLLTASDSRIYDSNGVVVAKYGATAVIGKEYEGHVVIGSTGMDVYGSNGTDSVARFGDSARIGSESEGHVTIDENMFTVYTTPTRKAATIGVSNDIDTGLITVRQVGEMTNHGTSSGPVVPGLWLNHKPESIVSAYLYGTSTAVNVTIVHTSTNLYYVATSDSSLVGELLDLTYATLDNIVSMSVGIDVIAGGPQSVAFGTESSAYGENSLSSGEQTSALGECSAAFGNRSEAIGKNSFAAGYHATAKGDWAAAFGNSSKAYGSYSFAAGYRANADALGSCAIGRNLEASEAAQFVIGEYNEISSAYRFAIGNGSSSARSNAFAVDKFGNVTAAGRIDIPRTEGTVTRQSAVSSSAGSVKMYTNGILATVIATGLKLNNELANNGSASILRLPSTSPKSLYRPPVSVWVPVASNNAGGTGKAYVTIGTDGYVYFYNRSGSAWSTSWEIAFTASWVL